MSGIYVEEDNPYSSWSPLVGKKKSKFHPTKPFFKYLILLLLSTVCFGAYYSYNEIGPIEHSMVDYLDISYVQFGLLYAVYSIPNIVLPFVGGFLADRLGLHRLAVICSILVVSGTTLVCLGMYCTDVAAYSLVVIGRAIYGIGSESLTVIQTTMVGIWFISGRELSFAMGLSLSMNRFADFLSLSIGVHMSQVYDDFRATLWLGMFLCIASFLSLLSYISLDKLALRYYDRPYNRDSNLGEFKVNAIKHFDKRYWLITCLCVLHYAAALSFIAVASTFLHSTYSYSSENAGALTGGVVLFALFCSPIVGKIIDYKGNRPLIILLGAIIMLPAFLLLFFSSNYYVVIPALFMIGVSFSCIPPSLWPSVSILIDSEELATAYGLMTAFQNAGLVLANMLVGYIGDKYDYQWAMLFLACLCVLAIVVAVVLMVNDKRMGNVLTGVEAEPEKKEKPYVVWLV